MGKGEWAGAGNAGLSARGFLCLHLFTLRDWNSTSFLATEAPNLLIASSHILHYSSSFTPHAIIFFSLETVSLCNSAVVELTI